MQGESKYCQCGNTWYLGGAVLKISQESFLQKFAYRAPCESGGNATSLAEYLTNTFPIKSVQKIILKFRKARKRRDRRRRRRASGPQAGPRRGRVRGVPHLRHRLRRARHRGGHAVYKKYLWEIRMIVFEISLNRFVIPLAIVVGVCMAVFIYCVK